MAWYKTGTVSVTNGQTSITGTGTKFATNARVGDGFNGPDGNWYEVTNITSETVLAIFPPYQGVTTSSSNYMIAPLQGYNKESADRLRAITDSLTAVTSVAGKTGAVTLNKSDVGLANIDNTSDLNKPISTATQTALTALQNGKKDNFTILPIAQGGTNATTPDAARTNITAAKSGANSDITEINALTKAITIAQGGTGSTTEAGARTNLGLGSAAVAAILGVVSQSGGTPTGALMEQGSNVNGSWFRFASGLMITFQSLNITPGWTTSGSVNRYAGPIVANTATSFASAPLVFVQVRDPSVAGRSAWCSGADGTNANTFSLFFSSPVASTINTSFNINVFCIGRWF